MTQQLATRAQISPVHEYHDQSFDADGPTQSVEAQVEAGGVLYFPQLTFELTPNETVFLDPRWADASAKNVSVRWPSAELRGAAVTNEPATEAALLAMIVRFAEHSERFALRLFPHYRNHLRRGNTSFRPNEVEGRPSSWRQDDSRLHVDAFPSNPMQGTRLLRVFSNINPVGAPRRWRIGEPFEAHARRYLPSMTEPLPGAAWLLEKTGITKSRRTDYDHAMLELHDFAKADAKFQQSSPQRRFDFAAGSTWVVFSDQVLHAAMGGQHMLEQTFYLDVEHQQRPESSPLRTLERLLGRALR